MRKDNNNERHNGHKGEMRDEAIIPSELARSSPLARNERHQVDAAGHLRFLAHGRDELELDERRVSRNDVLRVPSEHLLPLPHSSQRTRARALCGSLHLLA